MVPFWLRHRQLQGTITICKQNTLNKGYKYTYTQNRPIVTKVAQKINFQQESSIKDGSFSRQQPFHLLTKNVNNDRDQLVFFRNFFSANLSRQCIVYIEFI